MMKLPPMNTLIAFRLAAHRLNFSKAGEELNITHAAVSRQIKRLEEWYGRKLFERSGRGLKLNKAGQELLSTVDATLLALETTSQRIRVEKIRRSICVCCLPSIATRWLVPFLCEFMQVHPGIAIELNYAKSFQEFDPERHDILITCLDVIPEHARVTRIFARTSKPVAGASYFDEHKHRLQGTLEGARLLHDESRRDWEDWFSVAGFRPPRLIHGAVYPDFNILFTSVLAGHGIALCPIEVFSNEIDRGDLIVLSDIATRKNESYFMVSSIENRPAIAVFEKWFMSKISTVHP